MKLKNLNKILKGQRLELKQAIATFASSKMMFELIENNREYLYKWFDWVHEISQSRDCIRFLVEEEKKVLNNERAAYGIYLGDECIGAISCYGYDVENNILSLSYFLDKDYTGNGYMSEAVKIFENELFKKGAKRIEIRYNPENDASKSVAKNSGYKVEGILRNFAWKESRRIFTDIEMSSKLQDEWKEENKKGDK